MTAATPLALTKHFADLQDPRMDRTKRHLLSDILTISICAAICGCDDWSSVEEFGEAKADWFNTFLPLPNGIPSHDTFSRVFRLIDHQHFSDLFMTWANSLGRAKNDVIAV